MRSNRTEYLLSVSPTRTWGGKSWNSRRRHETPRRRVFADLVAAWLATASRGAVTDGLAYSSSTAVRSWFVNTISTAIYGFPALFRYDSFALVIGYWRCANRGRVGDQRKRGMTCSWDQENSGFPSVRFGGR